MITRLLGVLCLVMLVDACYPPSHVLLRVEDPNGATTDAVELRVQREDRSERMVAQGSLEFPLTVPLTSNVRGSVEVTVTAYDAAGSPVARVTKVVRLDRSGTPTDNVVIARICETVADCPDGDFCDGAPSCTDEGLCDYALPCVSEFPCVITSCNEETDTCNLTVDHGLCDSGFYCDPGSGCTQGQPCTPETVMEDCDDGNVCNGEEQCINFRCLGGIPPNTSDGDVCTLDGCDDNRRFTGEEPLFNIPLVSLNGSVCRVPDIDARGVCVAAEGGCAVSRCGDGVVDDGSEGGIPEVCDDGPRNSNEWDVEQHCNADCTGFGPSCGDANLDVGFETCDDGSRFDSGNGCSDTCQRNDGGCGDGVVQLLFEECDDGKNGDNCDGCRDDCRAGCLCATGAGCDAAGEVCTDGLCRPCNTVLACGAACLPCSGATPICGGVTEGCVCVADGSARGSCLPGTRCEAGVCTGCADAASCGPDCEACVGALDSCLGAVGGCAISSGSDCTGQPDAIRCSVASDPELTFDICSQGTCVSPGCGDPTCNPPGVYFPLADSNQRRCFNATAEIPCPGTPGDPTCATTPFCGQDAQYGPTDNTAQYEREELVPGEPVVHSKLSGLSWQGCVAGLSGSDCDVGSVVAGNWQSAVQYCEDLDWGGYSDWRLPSRAELLALQDYSRVASIDPVTFPNTPSDIYWSGDFSAGVPDYAWQVSFAESRVLDSSIVGNSPRRCVRGTPDPSSLPLVRYGKSEPVSGEPIVVDGVTSLVWQGCTSGLTGTACNGGTRVNFSWEGALSYCEGLSWGGFDDWSLPSVVELSSLTDPRRVDPTVDSTFFPATPGLQFWASSTYQLSPQFGWFVSFLDGDQAEGAKSNSFPVRCVRRP